MTTKFKNETKAKRITFLFIITFFTIAILCSCDKDKNKPVIEEEQPPVLVQPTCVTGKKHFEGKYRSTMFQNIIDTIDIVFIKNNCPTENSNTYSIKGLGKALNRVLNPTATKFPLTAITFTSNELEYRAYGSVPDYTIKISPNPSNYTGITMVISNFTENQNFYIIN